MSISYNHVVLIGRLTRDPEIKFAASGTQITTFTLAVDRNIPSSNNDNTDFIRIVSYISALCHDVSYQSAFCPLSGDSVVQMKY